MIEFNTNILWLITCSVLATLLVTLVFYLRYIVKNYKNVTKKYLESLAKQNEYCDKILELQKTCSTDGAKYINLLTEHIDLQERVSHFIVEHNSWHDRKIAFYYDKDGWHCLYADEIPQGDVVTEHEEINAQNENNNENNQSI